MAVPLEQFVKQLEDNGILDGETIKDFIPPKASPKDSEELAKELVCKKKLTKFQAEEVYRGKGKSLVLGNYVLMEKIGAGGMGQVFKARHRRMDRLVAVKLLPAATTRDKAVIARFEREVKAAAKLRHPNIVAADDADCANGVHFLVMELVDGQDLSAFVKKNGPLTIEKAVDFILQTARGLEFAHKKGVVHRDIKPANLLLDTEGTVKILDMGLARLGGVGDDSPQADLTSTGTIMGTVDYMAPEQAMDTKTADARADIYSLGCTLYYLLTGKATYEGDTLMKKLLAHREQSIPSLRADRPEIPEVLEKVFPKMLAKRVEDRFQTMTELIAELEKIDTGRQTTVMPDLSNRTVPSAVTKTFTFTNGFRDIQVADATHKTKPKAKRGQPFWKNIGVQIGAGLLGLLLLAGIIVSLQTKDGKLIVEVDQPDAMVQVLDSEGKVEISQKGGDGKITISVDPGKHRLKVVKDGFATYGQEFEMEQGGKKEITARLEPLKDRPVVVGTKPVPAVGEKKSLFFDTPAFDPWAKEVAAMPAEKQVEAVSKKLVELNPGFDGNLNPSFVLGVVHGLQFFTDNVTDISPVGALKGLTSLKCGGSSKGKGRLTDLSSLKGLPLAQLYFGWNQDVSDLSPLREMPLKDLLFFGTQVEDLSPLQGMKLTSLMCNVTKVSDLSPLRGMPLTVLYCDETHVADLSPLRDMSLTRLNVNYCQDIADLSPLKGMKLSMLSCAGTQVSDLSPLQGMPLTWLDCRRLRITDFTPLKDMPLQYFAFDFSPEQDTGLLRSIKTLDTINDKPAVEFWKEVGKNSGQ